MQKKINKSCRHSTEEEKSRLNLDSALQMFADRSSILLLRPFHIRILLPGLAQLALLVPVGHVEGSPRLPIRRRRRRITPRKTLVELALSRVSSSEQGEELEERGSGERGRAVKLSSLGAPRAVELMGQWPIFKRQPAHSKHMGLWPDGGAYSWYREVKSFSFF
jgi:hypothetical protein